MQRRRTSRCRKGPPRSQSNPGIYNNASGSASQVRAIVGQRLDIFVSNAGVSKAAAIEEHPIEDFDNLFATNVRSPFFLVKELLPLLREGSSIIVVSSLAARAAPGNPGQPGAPSLPAYAATKGRWKRWSSTGLRCSGRAASASMPSLRE